MNDEPKRYPLSVIYWEGRVHCISLNDYRIASGKAWGGGDPAATWDVSIAELCRAIPELARLVALGNAALAEDALTEERDAALERVKALEAGPSGKAIKPGSWGALAKTPIPLSVHLNAAEWEAVGKLVVTKGLSPIGALKHALALLTPKDPGQ